MLNINFNEAWNDLDSLNEKKQTGKSHAKPQEVEIKYTYNDIKDFLDGLHKVDDINKTAQEINNEEQKLVVLKSKIKQSFKDIAGQDSENYISKYNKFKDFESHISKKTYRHGSIGGPRRLALIYNTYLVEKAISEDKSNIKTQVLETICNIEGTEKTSAELKWQNDFDYFSTKKPESGETGSIADFICDCGTEPFGIEVKIAFAGVSFNATTDWSTDHAHNAVYIMRYFPTSKGLALYKLKDNSTTIFKPIKFYDNFSVDECLSIDEFTNYWPDLSELTKAKIDKIDN